ncbi:MAG: hypothetical protein M3462_03165 [Chloroflexota bacterium]|nr:hypothetical protein [Chloroflexota bacterium]
MIGTSRTPHRLGRLALTAILLLLAGLAPVGQARAQDAELSAQFDEITEEVSDIRELPIESDVVEAFLSREVLQADLLKTIDEDYPPSDRQADERLLIALGMLPEGTDLGELYVDLYSEQIAGYYDPETDELFVISGEDELSALDEVTYAHEVVHALQDQAFDLETIREPFMDSDDTILAITALIEGDATAAQLDYLLGDPQLLADFSTEIGDLPASPILDAAPAVIRGSLLFPYEAGQAFVTALREDDDWASVDAAFDDLPMSTEQILHPEKYTTERDDPTAVELVDLSDTLGAGWEALDENNFGEYQVRLMLEGELSGGGAEDAAAGWDGDRYAFYADEDEDVFVWQSVWDSEDEAAEFAAGLQEYDESRYDAEYEGDDTLTLDIDGASVRLVLDGDTVSYVLATDAGLADDSLAELAA